MRFKLVDGKFRSYEIVVCRYNEDISWVKDVPSYIDKYVYNKGSPLPDTIPLPNRGREGAAYLYHIIKRYDKISQVTIITQGRPFDHCRAFLEILHKMPHVKDLCPLNKNMLIDHIIRWTKANKWKKQVMPGSPWVGKDPGFFEYYNYLFKTPFDRRINIFSPGAQYAIPYKIIISRPKSFYEKILKTLDYAVDPLEGYFLEGLWQNVFNPSIEIH